MTFATQLRAIEQNAREHERRMLEATRTLLEAWAEEAKLYMRANAEWTNRTGTARWGDEAAQFLAQTQQLPGTEAIPNDGRGLDWIPIHPASIYDGGRIALISDAPYGIHLETARGAQFAIIMPTVAQLRPQLLAQLREIWK